MVPCRSDSVLVGGFITKPSTSSRRRPGPSCSPPVCSETRCTPQAPRKNIGSGGYGSLGFTGQVQHLLGCCGDGTMLWPASLRSALRFTICMQPVNLKTILRLHLTGCRRRSVGKCGATRELPRSGRGATSLSGLSNWPSVGANGWPLKLTRQPDLRKSVGKSLAMGHSPEQIAGRLALEHGRVIISHELNLSFHLSWVGPEGFLASPAAAP